MDVALTICLKACEWAIQGVLLLAVLTVAVYTISIAFVARVRRAAEERFAQRLQDIERKIKSSAEQLSKDVQLGSIDELQRDKEAIEKERREAKSFWAPLSVESAVLRPARLCLLSLVPLIASYALGTLVTASKGLEHIGGGILALILLGIGILLPALAITKYIVPALKKVDGAAQIEEGQRPAQVHCYIEVEGNRADSVVLPKNEPSTILLGFEANEDRMTSITIDVCFEPPLEPSRTDLLSLQRRPRTDRNMPNWVFYALNRQVWGRNYYWQQTFGIRCSQLGRYEIRVVGQAASHKDFSKTLYIVIQESRSLQATA